MKSRTLIPLFLVSLVLLPVLLFGQRSSKRSSADAVPAEFNTDVEDLKVTADTFDKAVTRKKPRFKGPFTVGIVFVNFPDCELVDVEACLAGQSEGVEDYYRRYTQNQCWPVFKVLGTYECPNPLGYYIRGGYQCNRIGSSNKQETASRVADLKRKAFASARGRADVMVLAYATKRAPVLSKKSTQTRVLERIPELRKLYPEVVRKQSQLEMNAIGYEPDEELDLLNDYRPLAALQWGDPLWPNSSVVVQAEGPASTMIHELGHVLGAPDTYHAPQSTHGGIPGTPVCVPGGPTAPLYARYRYCGLFGPNAYPIIRTSTTLRLAPRWEKFDGSTPLGIFIPTIHPNYLLHLEYQPNLPVARTTSSRRSSRGDYFVSTTSRYPTAGELPSESDTGPGGIYIYVIDVTKGGPYFGTSDLVHTYRRGDPNMRGVPDNYGTGKYQTTLDYGPAIFREGDAFDAESDPANVLPNTLPTGISLTFGPQDENGAEVTIQVPTQRLRGRDYTESLRPVVSLQPLTEVLPTSVRATLTMRYRGEPVYTDFGFCYGPKPNPTIKDKVRRLWGFTDWQDTTRIQGLPPGSKVYVRAFAQNEHGIFYSPECEEVTLPKTVDEVPPLLLDTLSCSLYQAKYDSGGYIYNATAAIALTKLMIHFQKNPADISGKKRFKRSNSSGTPLPEDAFSYERLHPDPNTSIFPGGTVRYAPTMKDLYAAYRYATTLAEASSLSNSVIKEDFENCATLGLNLPDPQRVPQGLLNAARQEGLTLKEAKALGEPVQPLTDKHLRLLSSRIRDSLRKAYPVLCVRSSFFESSRKYALHTAIIDGYRPSENGEDDFEFHIIYPSDIDRHHSTQRRTGWFPLSVLRDDHTDSGRIIFFQ